METKKIKGERVKCGKCKYVWKTKSKLISVSCPSCGNKVKLDKRLYNE